MLKIVDHLKEPEKAIVRNVAKVRAALARGEKVCIYHMGRIHGRLSNLPGVEYRSLAGIQNTPAALSRDTDMLIAGWTAPFSRRLPLPKCGGTVYIHWAYVDRTEDKLSRIEQFHLNELYRFGVDYRFDEVCIYVATPDGLPRKAALDAAGRFGKVIFARNDPVGWEGGTFRKLAEASLTAPGNYFYLHFKGVTHCADPHIARPMRNPRRWGGRNVFANIMYACDIMYRAILSPQYVGLLGNGYEALGGIRRKDPDRPIPGWAATAIRSPGYHNSGSFAAWTHDGAIRRYKPSPDHFMNPYDVEKFLTGAFPDACIHWLERSNTADMYSLYTNGEFPMSLRQFSREAFAPDERHPIVISNWSLEGIGGSETHSFALACGLRREGYPVMYWTPKDGATGKRFQEKGILPWDGRKPFYAISGQSTGRHFQGICPVIQIVQGVVPAERPIPGMDGYVAISNTTAELARAMGGCAGIIPNGIDVERFCPKRHLNSELVAVLSLCQGDDSILREACAKMGVRYVRPEGRVWEIEDLMQEADLVVGVGRTLLDAMACGRCVLSWDNRDYFPRPAIGFGYIPAEDAMELATRNFVDREGPSRNVDWMIAQLRRYDPADGERLHELVRGQFNVEDEVRQYLALMV